jgi:hypothetical protein
MSSLVSTSSGHSLHTLQYVVSFTTSLEPSTWGISLCWLPILALNPFNAPKVLSNKSQVLASSASTAVLALYMPHSMVKVASFCQIAFFLTLAMGAFLQNLASILYKMDNNSWLFYKIKYFWPILRKFPLFFKF